MDFVKAPNSKRDIDFIKGIDFIIGIDFISRIIKGIDSVKVIIIMGNLVIVIIKGIIVIVDLSHLFKGK